MADDQNNSRLRLTHDYPNIVYVEALMMFFGANFIYHQNIFRKAGSRPHFFAFMLVNCFISY